MSSVSLQRGLQPIVRNGVHAAHAFRLGGWRVEPRLGRISTERTERVVEPKVMEVLVHLAARRGEVVSSDELIAIVWAGRPMGDNPVHRCVSILRRALGDDAHRPRYIGTIPKRGYRVVAPVEAVAGDPPCGDCEVGPLSACVDVASEVRQADAVRRRESGGLRDPAAGDDVAVLEGVLRVGGRELRFTAVFARNAGIFAEGDVLQRLGLEHIAGVVRSAGDGAAGG